MIYYQIEYCELGSLDMILLSESLRDNNKVKPELWDFALDILLGLDCLHQSGFVHMDIKPSNIFLYKLNGRRRLKIGDFGTLTEINTSIKEEGDGLYIAPEVLLGDILTDPRFDVYSAGITIYEMVSNYKITPNIWNKIKEQDYVYLGFDDLEVELQTLLKTMLLSINERPTISTLLHTNEQIINTAQIHSITLPNLGDIKLSQFPSLNNVNILSPCKEDPICISPTIAKRRLF